VLEFDMVDARFVEESDVLGGLDQRPNLMDLTPGEFESLITNLFEQMGLETRQTQASRDGESTASRSTLDRSSEARSSSRRSGTRTRWA
jgi:hypothetical protein